jgi:hypothetical protein
MSTKSVEWRISIVLWNFMGIWIETQIFLLQSEFYFQHQEAKCFCTGMHWSANQQNLIAIHIVPEDLVEIWLGHTRFVSC